MVHVDEGLEILLRDFEHGGDGLDIGPVLYETGYSLHTLRQAGRIC
jgi:hypothetical protein